MRGWVSAEPRDGGCGVAASCPSPLTRRLSFSRPRLMVVSSRRFSGAESIRRAWLKSDTGLPGVGGSGDAAGNQRVQPRAPPVVGGAGHDLGAQPYVAGVQFDELVQGNIPVGAVEQGAAIVGADPVQLPVEKISPGILDDEQRGGHACAGGLRCQGGPSVAQSLPAAIAIWHGHIPVTKPSQNGLDQGFDGRAAMKVTVMGSGYVGLVTAACLAQVGHQVHCFDVDGERIARLERGEVPLFEPGLDAVIAAARAAGSLAFSADEASAIRHGQLIFIAVGTPQDASGAADIGAVLAAAGMIGQYLEAPAVVITKSTVPVGTTQRVRDTVARTIKARHASIAFDVASNPEFLKEGSAVGDFMKPDRILVGTDSPKVEKLLRQLYAPFNRNHERLMVMDIRSAELTKYAANAMPATKISFINEIANIAERLGADVEKVRQGIGADPRIGYHFIYP